MNARWRLPAWFTLLLVVVSSCSTTMNIRVEDYSRVEPDRTYLITTSDNRAIEAKDLVIAGDTATFTHEGEKMSLPLDQIQLIQQINDNELVTGLVGIGIVTALLVGLVVVATRD